MKLPRLRILKHKLASASKATDETRSLFSSERRQDAQSNTLTGAKKVS